MLQLAAALAVRLILTIRLALAVGAPPSRRPNLVPVRVHDGRAAVGSRPRR